jgi:hypothetical protein
VAGTRVTLCTACDNTLKPVPLVALYWTLTAENCAQWRAAIADFTAHSADAVASLQWSNADHAATGQPAITEFAAPVAGWQGDHAGVRVYCAYTGVCMPCAQQRKAQ